MLLRKQVTTSDTMYYAYNKRQACQQEKFKKSENSLCALSRLALPAEHVSWGFWGRSKPPDFFWHFRRSES